MKRFLPHFLFPLICSLIFTVPLLAEVTTGNPAPEFSLWDVQGQTHSLSDFKGKYVVLEWVNPDCPFVKKHYDSKNMQNLQKTYTRQGVVWLSINSSAQGKEGAYSPEQFNQWTMEKDARPTVLLLDTDGKVGKSYGAQTTPHMFVINPEGTLIYQGAIDSIASTDSADIEKATNYVQKALSESMAGKAVSTPATKSYGCSVKY